MINRRGGVRTSNNFVQDRDVIESVAAIGAGIGSLNPFLQAIVMEIVVAFRDMRNVMAGSTVGGGGFSVGAEGEESGQSSHVLTLIVYQLAVERLEADAAVRRQVRHDDK